MAAASWFSLEGPVALLDSPASRLCRQLAQAATVLAFISESWFDVPEGDTVAACAASNPDPCDTSAEFTFGCSCAISGSASLVMAEELSSTRASDAATGVYCA